MLALDAQPTQRVEVVGAAAPPPLPRYNLTQPVRNPDRHAEAGDQAWSSARALVNRQRSQQLPEVRDVLSVDAAAAMDEYLLAGRPSLVPAPTPLDLAATDLVARELRAAGSDADAVDEQEALYGAEELRTLTREDLQRELSWLLRADSLPPDADETVVVKTHDAYREFRDAWLTYVHAVDRAVDAGMAGCGTCVPECVASPPTHCVSAHVQLHLLRAYPAPWDRPLVVSPDRPLPWILLRDGYVSREAAAAAEAARRRVYRVSSAHDGYGDALRRALAGRVPSAAAVYDVARRQRDPANAADAAQAVHEQHLRQRAAEFCARSVAN